MTEQQARLQELIVEYERGLVSLNDEELLTLVLCPVGKPSKRMATIAQRILRSCGLQGLTRELVNAPAGLTRFGLTTQQVNRLKMAYELITRCHLLNRMTRTSISSADDIARLVRPEMMHLDHEEFHILVLDTKNQIVEYVRPYKGTANSAALRVSEIFRPAIVRNCTSIIVCHNHPSGNPQASLEDRAVTRQLVDAGRLLDIELLDHLIIGNPEYVSLKAEMRW